MIIIIVTKVTMILIIITQFTLINHISRNAPYPHCSIWRKNYLYLCFVKSWNENSAAAQMRPELQLVLEVGKRVEFWSFGGVLEVGKRVERVTSAPGHLHQLPWMSCSKWVGQRIFLSFLSQVKVVRLRIQKDTPKFRNNCFGMQHVCIWGGGGGIAYLGLGKMTEKKCFLSKQRVGGGQKY